MNTIYLDPTAWDLALNNSGNIALAGEPWSLAQDAASAIRTFSGEVYYDTTQGVPYWASILGLTPAPMSLIKSEYVAAALTVPDVDSAVVFFSDFSKRKLSGQIQITSVAGSVAAATFGR